MIRGRCPTCGKPFEVATIDDLPGFPFCSERCRLVNLGRWLDDAHAIPAPTPPVEEQEASGDED